jgi:hypothetical protein
LTSVLGFPLKLAEDILAAEGYRVEAKETRSKKGVAGGTEQRVIRQSAANGNEVTLLYALFQTEPNETND